MSVSLAFKEAKAYLCSIWTTLESQLLFVLYLDHVYGAKCLPMIYAHHLIKGLSESRDSASYADSAI